MKSALILVVALALAAAQSLEEMERLNKPTVLCGRQLSRAVTTACSQYEITKRAEARFQLPWSEEPPRGKRQGIVDECCKQACTITTLLSYC